MAVAGPRTVGVEEELLLLAPDSARIVGVAQQICTEGIPGVVNELKADQVELVSGVHIDLAELSADLLARRAVAAAAAGRHGARLVGVGTHLLDERPTPFPGGRYDRIGRTFGLLARDQLTCGVHVHVGIANRVEGIAVLDRIRAWLPVLRAISANSPFARGVDSGHASWRSMVLSQLPNSGPAPLWHTTSGYDAAIRGLIDTGVAFDAGMFYYDARLSARFPTVEVRVGDVGAGIGTSVLSAALCRALVSWAVADWSRGNRVRAVSDVAMSAASWQAARYGLTAELLDPRTRCTTLVPAAEGVRALLDLVADPLADAGDTDLVSGLLESFLGGEVGAPAQRAVFASTQSLDAVADELAAHVSRAPEKLAL